MILNGHSLLINPQCWQLFNLVIGQGGLNALLQLVFGDFIFYLKDNCAIAFKLEDIWENFPESFNKTACTLKVHCILAWSF